MTVDITTALSRALGSSGGHTTVEVTLNATAKTKPTNRHVGLLIDTSGSMAGPKIQHAKRGAKRALRELDDDDYVSVVGFDAATETVLPMTNWGAVDHERAIADVDGIRSGGGTDIYNGLELVRSNSEGDIGFLGRDVDGPRRLNVALTRAKQYCAVVGDFHTLRYDAPGKCTDLYRDFRDYFDTTGRLNHVDPDFIPV